MQKVEGSSPFIRSSSGVAGATTATAAMQIVNSVVVDCHAEDVSDFLADRYRIESDRVRFELEPVWTSTRVTRLEERTVRAPRALFALLARRQAARELRALKQALERLPRRS
jgi:hypothetical protein